MRTVWSAVVAIAAYSGMATAHHSTNVDYDVSKFVTETGEVVETKWINPHSILMFNVTNANGGKELWAAETHGAAVLARHGWRKDLFKPGMHVAVWGNPARHAGKKAMHMLKVTLPDGKVLDVNKVNSSY
jgi:DNA/RNA endonuclease YhcR with UshA esterase domain